MPEKNPDKLPQTPASSPETKPNGFQRVMKGIGNGMKGIGEGLASVVGGVARIGVEFVKGAARLPVELVKGADALVSHIPIVGGVYGAGKEVVKGVWGVTEELPVLGSVFKGLREGAGDVAGKLGFTSEEQLALLEKQKILLSGQEKDFIDREKIQKIIQDHPELKSHFDEYFKNIAEMKTGKENMSLSDLLKEGENLKKEIIKLSKEETGAKKGDVYQNEYLDFQKSFSSLPEYSSLDKNSKEYSLLQNIYFAREPRPNLANPIVKEFIQKSLVLSFSPNKNEYGKLTREQNKFALENSQVIAQEFHMSPLEKNMMEYLLNKRERGNRLPPIQLLHDHKTNDYGLGGDFVLARNTLFSEDMNEIDEAVSRYPGTILSIFQGGGH